MRRMTTALRIKRARHAAGLTQEELARRVGVGVRNVPGWESGKSVPRAKTLRRIAEVTGVEVSELVVLEDTSEAARSRAVDPFASAFRALVHSAISEEIERVMRDTAASQSAH